MCSITDLFSYGRIISATRSDEDFLNAVASEPYDIPIIAGGLVD